MIVLIILFIFIFIFILKKVILYEIKNNVSISFLEIRYILIYKLNFGFFNVRYKNDRSF